MFIVFCTVKILYILYMSKLKNGKATGHDQILTKLFTEGGKELKKAIYELI